MRYYNFWDETLLEHGFEHPIPTDAPHYELFGNAAFRDESAYLQELSVLAFERLWNRNNPEDAIAEDGVYDAETKARLGDSPVEGFPIGACPAGSGGDGWDAGPVDGGPDTSDTGADIGTPDTGADTGVPDAPDTSSDTDSGMPDADDATSDDGGPGDARPDADRPRAPSMYSLVPADGPTSARGCAVASERSVPTGTWLVLAGAAFALVTRRRA